MVLLILITAVASPAAVWNFTVGATLAVAPDSQVRGRPCPYSKSHYRELGKGTFYTDGKSAGAGCLREKNPLLTACISRE